MDVEIPGVGTGVVITGVTEHLFTKHLTRIEEVEP
jgi:hypothetical protein